MPQERHCQCGSAEANDPMFTGMGGGSLDVLAIIKLATAATGPEPR